MAPDRKQIRSLEEAALDADAGQDLGAGFWRAVYGSAPGRECELVLGSVKGALADEMNSRTAVQAVGSFGAGVVLGVLQRRAGIARMLVEATGLVLGYQYMEAISNPDRWRAAGDAWDDAWRSPENLSSDISLMSNSLGRLAVDSALMFGLTALGGGIGQLGHNRARYWMDGRAPTSTVSIGTALPESGVCGANTTEYPDGSESTNCTQKPWVRHQRSIDCGSVVALNPVTGMHAGSSTDIGTFDSGSDGLAGPDVAASAELSGLAGYDASSLLAVARQAALGGEKVGPKVLEQVRDTLHQVDFMKPAEIRDALRDILISSNPDVGLDVLMDSGIMSKILPEVAELNGPRGNQTAPYHTEGNVWVHTKLVLKNLRKLIAHLPADTQFTEMMAALLHDVGKPETAKTTKGGRITHFGHAEKGAAMVDQICQRLEIEAETAKRIRDLVDGHMKMHLVREMTLKRLERLLNDPILESRIRLQRADAEGTFHDSSAPHCPCDLPAAGADDEAAGGRVHEPFLRQALEDYRERRDIMLQAPKPLVTGDTLISMGITPGPRFRGILAECKAAQETGEFTTSEQAIAWLKAKYG